MLSVASLALMVVLVFVNVVLRYALNSGITLSEELSRWLFVWLVLVGAACALREHGHMGSEFVTARLSARGRRVCWVLAQNATLGILVLLLWGGWQLVLVNYPVEAPTSRWSMAILYLPCAVFAALGLCVVAAQLLRVLAGAPLPGPAHGQPTGDDAERAR